LKINRQTIIDAFSEQALDKIGVRRVERMLEQNNVVALGSIVVMLTCTYLMRGTSYAPAMLVWVGINALLSAARWGFVYRPIKRKQKAGQQITRKDQSAYTIVRFGLVCLWAVGGYLFLPTTDNAEIFIGFVLIFAGVLTAAVQNNTAATTALPLIYVYPVVLGLVIRMLELEYYFYAFIMTVYCVYASSLVISISKLEKRTQKVESENEELLNDLILQKEKADKANTQKSNFMAAASHDLRQPLNSLGLFLYSHRAQLKEVQKQGQRIDVSALDGADRAFTALQDLFDAITEVSRLDEGSISVSIQSITLDDIVSPLVQELDVIAKGKGLRLEYLPSSLCVASDPRLLMRILRNLIGNAIKYTEVGSVVVSEIRHADHLEVAITDTGTGIAKREQLNIFDEYYQIENQKRQRSDGIGLGLSIVKRTAKLLGHPLSLESTLGKGSSFTITLPLCSESNKEAVDKNSTMMPMNGVSILVIDDEDDALVSMQGVLQGWGCDVALAETPEQARGSVKLAKPDIILSDYRLHESINGIELLQSLKQEFDFSGPCLIVSGDKSEQLLRDTKKHGFVCIDKPVDIGVLNNLLFSLIHDDII
jgi:signal transduction histidine kinase/CheY-like chemotaxis protein